MSKKRTLQNNLSYALKYIFDNYGINIFADSQKFLATLDNLIPNLPEEMKLVEFAIQKKAISPIINAYNQRDIDKNFAYLRAKTILLKNDVPEKGALYIVDCFLYAINWIEDVPKYEDLSDEDFKIPEIIVKESIDNDFAKKLNNQIEIKKSRNKSAINLNKDNTSNATTKNEETIEPLYFEEKSLSFVNKETIEDKNLKQESNKKDTLTNSKYYLNHNFDEDDDYDDDYDDYDDDYESSHIFKKIALILIPIIILGCLGFFLFKNFNKEAEPVVSGVSITTEYQIENGDYVLPINKETILDVIIHSNNSKQIDLSKLSFKVKNSSICIFKNDGKKCTITGLKEGSTELVVIYNNEIIDSIKLIFKDLSAQEDSTVDEEEATQPEGETTPQEETTETQQNNNTNSNQNNNNDNYNSGVNNNNGGGGNSGGNNNNGGGNSGGNNNNGGGGNSGGNNNNGGGGNSGGNNNNGGGGNSGDNNNGGGGNSGGNNNNGGGGNSGDNNNGGGGNSGGNNNNGGGGNSGDNNNNDGSNNSGDDNNGGNTDDVEEIIPEAE